MTTAHFLPGMLPGSMISWLPFLNSIQRDQWLLQFGTDLTTGSRPTAYFDVQPEVREAMIRVIRKLGGRADVGDRPGRILLIEMPDFEAFVTE